MGVDVRWDPCAGRVVLKAHLVWRAILVRQKSHQPVRKGDIRGFMIDTKCFVGEVVAVVERGAAGAFWPCEFVLEDVDELGFVLRGNEVVVH